MAEYSKDSIKVNYDSQAESFKPSATLRAAQMASIDQAIVASADAEKVAEALSEIDNKTDVLTNQVGTVPDGSTVMEEIEDIRSSTEEELAKKATGLYLHNDNQKLYLLYGEETVPDTDRLAAQGIGVVTSLADYSTTAQVEAKIQEALKDVDVSEQLNSMVEKSSLPDAAGSFIYLNGGN